MNIKQTIEAGEKLLKEYKRILTQIDNVNTIYDEKKAVMVLIDIHKIRISERAEMIEKRLSEKKKEYLEFFEKLSAECNLHMDNTIAQAKQYIGKEPVGITNQIEELLNKYESKKDDIEQEEKNNIYDELKGHCRFMKKVKK